MKLPEDAYFCPKCGTRTDKGAEAGAHYPQEELRETFSKIGEELEKAFTVAGKEIEKAFSRAKESFRETKGKKAIVCQRCKERNPPDASFCFKCGEKLG